MTSTAASTRFSLTAGEVIDATANHGHGGVIGKVHHTISGKGFTGHRMSGDDVTGSRRGFTTAQEAMDWVVEGVTPPAADEFDFSAWDGVTRVAVRLLEADVRSILGRRSDVARHGAATEFACTEAAVPDGPYLAAALRDLFAWAYTYNRRADRIVIEVYDGEGRHDRQVTAGELYRMVQLYDTTTVPAAHPHIRGEVSEYPLHGYMALVCGYTSTGLLHEASQN